MEENTNSYHSEKPNESESLSCKYYQNICDLPLDRFITCATDKNLSALIISGFPTEDELIRAWAIIMEQYAEAIGDHETRMKFNLWKDILRLQMKIKHIYHIVDLLRECMAAYTTYKAQIIKTEYIPLFVTELNRLLVATFFFDVNKPEEFSKKLQTALNRTKGPKLHLDMKVMEYDAMASTEGGEEMGKQYFQTVLRILRKAEGFMIKDTDITVFEFCDLIKAFNKENEKRK